MPASSLQITKLSRPELASLIYAGDPAYPRNMYAAGMPVATVCNAAELAALGAGWFPYPVYS